MASNERDDWQEVDDWQELTTEEPEKMSFGEGLGRSALESLPMAGALFGGATGLMAGPVGAVGGAGLGAAAGKALEQTGKRLFFDEGPSSRVEQYKELASEGATGLTSEMGGQALTKGLSLAGQGLKKAGPKIGSAFTGVPEQEIKTYAKNANQIKQMAKETDASTIEAADQIRNQFNKDIANRTSQLNESITQTLSNSTKRIEAKPIVDSLESYKAKINPKLYPEQVGQIDDLINRVNNVSQGGQISTLEAHQVKQFLQDKASSAYRNGDIFQIGTEAANAAKSGAKTARELVSKAEPSVAEANKILSRFHEIEDSMNSNILKVGSPEAALMAAGSGGNPRNVRALEQLGELTNTPMLEQAQNLAAMRTFTNTPIMPMDTTGKSATRMGAAAALGMLGGGPVGGVVGGAMSSPLMLKSAMDIGRTVSPAIKAIGPSEPTREILYKGLMQKYFSSPDNQIKEQSQEKQNPDTSMIMEKIKGSEFEQVLQNALSKGKESFAAANYVLGNRNKRYQELMRG